MLKKTTIIGCGTMGEIFLEALKKWQPNLKISATVSSEERLNELKQKYSEVEFTLDNKVAVQSADLVILAVKPQTFAQVGSELKGLINQDALVLSIMAGVKIENIKQSLEVEKVVRLMPTLGARLGKSITSWTLTGGVGEEEKILVEELLRMIGEQLYLESEEMIDKASAVSPGFFFFVIEKWLKAVVNMGFSREQAKKIILTTVDGCGDLLQSGIEPEELVKQVASKGGVTEAGLEVFKKVDLEKIWQEVLRAAVERTKELSK